MRQLTFRVLLGMIVATTYVAAWTLCAGHLANSPLFLVDPIAAIKWIALTVIVTVACTYLLGLYVRRNLFRAALFLLVLVSYVASLYLLGWVLLLTPLALTEMGSIRSIAQGVSSDWQVAATILWALLSACLIGFASWKPHRAEG